MTLLPTPAVNDMGEGKTVDAWDEWTAKMKAAHGNGNGHGASLAIEAQRLAGYTDDRCDECGCSVDMHDADDFCAGPCGGSQCHGRQRLLPTPTSQAAKHYGNDTDRGEGSPDDHNLWITAQRGRWGDYAAAIARWETRLRRTSPEPTMTSAKGNPQLSPQFVEFLMGLPAGWVTDTPGITRNEALKALGNGVVPQQAAEALRVMASWSAVAA